jgi:hypothetical protein
MLRAIAVGLSALVLLDRYLLDGRYVDALEAMARSLAQFVIGYAAQLAAFRRSHFVNHSVLPLHGWTLASQ